MKDVVDAPGYFVVPASQQQHHGAGTAVVARFSQKGLVAYYLVGIVVATLQRTLLLALTNSTLHANCQKLTLFPR